MIPWTVWSVLLFSTSVSAADFWHEVNSTAEELKGLTEASVSRFDLFNKNNFSTRFTVSSNEGSYFNSEPDPIFNEVLSIGHNANSSLSPLDYDRNKRGILELARIIDCASGCNLIYFQPYGCFCGFLGSGTPVDAIDKCCQMHDWCYTVTSCMEPEYTLPYFVPFKWKCNGGSPYCIPGKTPSTNRGSCSHQLCECDREFGMCLKKIGQCPKSHAQCPGRNNQQTSPGISSKYGASSQRSRVSSRPPLGLSIGKK